MGVVSYEATITIYCTGEIEVPDDVLAQGEEAIEEWLNDNEAENAEDYGDRDVEWEFSVEDEEGDGDEQTR